MKTLHLFEFEDRNCPSGIPGWDGQTSVIGFIDNTVLFAAGVNGGPRVLLQSDNGNGAVIWDRFAGAEETFRGGVRPVVYGDHVYVGAGDTGGPRVDVLEKATGILVDSFFIDNPELRNGADVESWLKTKFPSTTQQDPVYTPAIIPPKPRDIDPLANSISGFAGYPDRGYLDPDTIKFIVEGPNYIGVSFVFDTIPDDTTIDWQTRAYLPSDIEYILWKSGIDTTRIYFAVGVDNIAIARECLQYIQITVTGPSSTWDVNQIANETITKLNS